MPRMPENELDRGLGQSWLPCLAQAALITLHALAKFHFSRVAQACPSDPVWRGPNWNFFQVSLTENDNSERRTKGGKRGRKRELQWRHRVAGGDRGTLLVRKGAE